MRDDPRRAAAREVALQPLLPDRPCGANAALPTRAGCGNAPSAACPKRAWVADDHERAGLSEDVAEASRFGCCGTAACAGHRNPVGHGAVCALREVVGQLRLRTDHYRGPAAVLDLWQLRREQRQGGR